MIEITCTNRAAVIQLDIEDPNDIEAIEIDGDQTIGDELGRFFGLRHGFNPEASSGFDLISALASAGIEYEITQGAEILDMPEEEVPEGADS